jgi:hypothetical protein
MAFARAPVEYRAYNTNMEFANFRLWKRGQCRVRPLPSAIALLIRARNAVIAAAAIVHVIRRTANQFRNSGILPASQPGMAQKR